MPDLNLSRPISRALLFILLMGSCTGRLWSASPPVVDLDARDFTDGHSWPNKGSIHGSFSTIGTPSARTIDGIRAVSFADRRDAFVGPLSPVGIDGNAPRTIEVWAYNPDVTSEEEIMVSWGKRGGPSGSLMAFGWGRNTDFGGASHWAADLGWTKVPAVRQWHCLVYTYDGGTARIYDNGAPQGQRKMLNLNTPDGCPILIGAENSAQGKPTFTNEFTRQSLGASLAIASIRIREGALTAEEIRRNFETESARFLGLVAQGSTKFDAGPFKLVLQNETQTAASLSPDGQFDFLPSDLEDARSAEGYYHLGDVTLRARAPGDSTWKSYSSATRAAAIKPISDPKSLAACDLTPNLGADCPVQIERRWVVENGKLSLRFAVTNTSARPVEIGAFGAAMVFNNYLTHRTLDEAHTRCSFATPAINGAAGYLEVTRLNGSGPALLVLPEKGTSFEAYRRLYEDPTQPDVTFEGFYEWMTHSLAYAETEWKGAAGYWNPPTSKILAPGESMTVGYRFALSPSIRRIEDTLFAEKQPVAVGAPGYVLATDTPGKLFLHYNAAPKSLSVEPDGSLSWYIDPNPTRHGWRVVDLIPRTPGRSRLLVTYADGMTQSISYFAIPPEPMQVRRLGHFLATRQWFNDPNDPFHRTNSWLPFDRLTDSIVTQHPHSWFVGLSDEIGAAPSVAMATKNAATPAQDEVAQLDLYGDTALFGNVQNPDFSIRASLFYYDPKALPHFHYTVHEGWDKARSETTWRTYNYPHVTAVWLSLYRLARNYQGLSMRHSWDFYLERAYQTATAMSKFASRYDRWGLMVGSIFPQLVDELRREGWNEKADAVENYGRRRESIWATLKYPFGSEMPWDSTGQEEIYTWCRRFGADDKAQATVDAITGYMPAVPNWAYNGAARRYFDASVNGNAWQEIVQNTNHYGSSLNAIPILDAFRRDPNDFYLLRIGYAGMDQILCNIDPRGFASYGFDTDPAHLDFDPYTADYGIAFYGYAYNAGTYVVRHPEFGWLAFGGTVDTTVDHIVRVMPHDGFRKRLFFAPEKLWITLDSGEIEQLIWNNQTEEATLVLAAATPYSKKALLRLETPGEKTATYVPRQRLNLVRGFYEAPLGPTPVTLILDKGRH